MAQAHQFITDQDFEAYADGALNGDRLAAVEARMQAEPRRRASVEAISYANDGLRALKDVLYRDPELSAALVALKFRPRALEARTA